MTPKTYHDLIGYLQARLFEKNYTLALDREQNRVRGALMWVIIPIIVVEKIRILWLFSVSRMRNVGLMYCSPNSFIPWPEENDWKSAYIGEEEIWFEVYDMTPDSKDKKYIQSVVSSAREWCKGIDIVLLEI